MQLPLAAMIDDLAALVGAESPSGDLEALRQTASVTAGVGARHLGKDPEWLVRDERPHLLWRFPGPMDCLLLGHLDTVWPLGTLARRPFGVRGDIITGPGCFDMKAGLVQLFHAVGAVSDRSGLAVLVTSDEEIGSPSSRGLIEELATQARSALVLEGAAPGGALKTARKGVSMYRIEITGRAAHAGLDPERGVNAAVELAHQILAIGNLASPSDGTTVTPSVATAGTTVNTVPGTATLAVDVRASTTAEQLRVDQAIHNLRPRMPSARLTVTGGANRLPMEVSASAGLYERAVRAAKDLGQPPPPAAAVGGASDANLTAALGLATLDGLGAVGGGAHADDEHVIASTMQPRTALLTGLLTALTSADPSEG
jgi:glutamate carboxypeptidase